MSMQDFQRLEPTIARLQTYYESVRGSMASAKLPPEAISGINTQFSLVATYLRRLKASGDLGAGLIAGAITATRWVGIANEQGNALASIARQIDSEDLWSRAWTEIVVATVDDVRDGAGAVVAAAPGALTSITVLVGLLVVYQVLRMFK